MAGRRNGFLVAPLVLAFSWSGTAHASPPAGTQIPTPNTNAVRPMPSDVALSGDILVIGDRLASSAYVFARSGSTFTSQATFAPAPFGQFGWRVAASGSRSRVVAGAQADTNGGGVNTGAVYVFERNQGIWAQTAKLTPGDGAASDHFGYSVALAGDRLVVGAPGHASNAGAAYVFDNVSGVWSLSAEVTASDGVANQSFGSSVALNGSLVLVGAIAPGAGYMFTCPTGSCTQTAKLVAPASASPYTSFGWAVAVYGTRAIIGAPNTMGYLFAPVDGYARVFEFDGSAWQPTVVWSSTGSAGFGTSLALGPARAVVGAPLNTDLIQPGMPAAAFVYDHTSSGWASPVMLSPGSDPTVMSIDFGASVTLDGDLMAVAPIETSWNTSTSQGTGTAVLFSLAAPQQVPAGGPLLAGAVALALLVLGAGSLSWWPWRSRSRSER